MAANSYGAQNQPLFSETGAPAEGTDLSLVSNYCATVGNRKIGTTAQRTALTGSDRWTGMKFWDTTLDYEFVWDGSAWAGLPVAVADASASVTIFTNWTLTTASYVLLGSVIEWRFAVTRNAAITGNADGDIGNAQILTIDDVNKRPLTTHNFATDSTGYHCQFAVTSTGILYVCALPPGVSAINGDVFTFSTMYFRNV